MAKKSKKPYRDRFGRFAKRGQPLKPPQPRIQGRYVSRPAPLRLGINKQGKRYWIKPRAKKPKRIIEGPIYLPPPQETEEIGEIVEEEQKRSVPYGYDVDDFMKIRDHPTGYSYVTYHIFYSPTGSPQNGVGGGVITIRGQMYNTPDEVIEGWEGELRDIEETGGVEDMTYIRTIVAVIPASGDERVGGAVYPRDYNPVERPGTREYEIEEGKKRLREFGPPLE